MRAKTVKAAGGVVKSRRARAYLNFDSLFVMVVTTAFLAALIGVSFIQSFTALVAVAAWTGLPSVLGWTVPATVDSAILIFTLSALVMRARNQPRATGYAWSMLLLFTTLSIAANTMHALDSTVGEDLRRVITGAVLAGCAPFVVFTASHMLSLIVIDPADAPSLRAMTRQASGETTRREPVTPSVATTMVATRDTTIEWAASHVSQPVSRQVTRDATSMVDAMIRDAIASGEMPSGAQIGAWLGDKSSRTGQRYLSALLERDTALESAATSLSRQATRGRMSKGASDPEGVAFGSRDTSGDTESGARDPGNGWAATA